jgi:hypothetical protein
MDPLVKWPRMRKGDFTSSYINQPVVFLFYEAIPCYQGAGINPKDQH